VAPACRTFGLDGLRTSGLAGFCNRATHNLWILLKEAQWVDERLTNGTYQRCYQVRLAQARIKKLSAAGAGIQIRRLTRFTLVRLVAIGYPRGHRLAHERSWLATMVGCVRLCWLCRSPDCLQCARSGGQSTGITIRTNPFAPG
jgi:hypothetical protein